MEGSTPNEREDIFIGLMSGTSMDGVDAAAVNFVDNKLCLIASLKLPYPSSIKEDLLKVTDVRKQFSLKHIACLDISIGNFFATTVQQLINEASFISCCTVVAKKLPIEISRHAICLSENCFLTSVTFKRSSLIEDGYGSFRLAIKHNLLSTKFTAAASTPSILVPDIRPIKISSLSFGVLPSTLFTF